MPAARSSKQLPKEYTFLNSKTIISKKGKAQLLDLFDKAKNRDPDYHDMYIYNDFLGYAMIWLVNSIFKTMNPLVTKSKWDELYPLVESLAQFFLMDGDAWMQVDDEEFAVWTNKAYGSILVTMLRGLETQGRLDELHFASLEDLLKAAAEWGDLAKEMECRASYSKVCKAFGKRLFAGKEAARKKAREEMVDAWKKKLEDGDEDEDEDDEDDDEDEDDDDDEDDDEDDKPWYHKGVAKDAKLKASDLNYTTTWKAYKKYASGVPSVPLRGPPNWDLTKWKKSDKAQFSFDNDDDDFGF
ncbi:hypothetical protein DL96DRAFT_1803725 [Flagelloscypha sp. PMI_526]|nr:hypothetical protein DL96DRAFT_1803725 [Flagelloscypha sp. PMI_526]